MFLAVVLIFGVACSAFPTSEDGAECLVRCYFERGPRNVSEDLTDSVSEVERSRARSASKSEGVRVCKRFSSFSACLKSCPSMRQDAVMHQITRLAQTECSPSVSELQREKFLQSYEDLDTKLSARAARCQRHEPENDDALCKGVASCLLGSALDELKSDYPKDVVTLVADVRKLMLSFSLKDPKSPPDACSFLYEPTRHE